MALIPSLKASESTITVKHGRDGKFLIRRSRTPEGFEVFVIENQTRNERLSVPRELFDRFRATLLELSLQPPASQKLLERKIYFEELDYYSIRPALGEGQRYLIQELIKQAGSTGLLTVPLDAMGPLAKALYQPVLKHTSEVFDRILSYHKLFHFSFTEGSESITSDLAMRRDVLSQIDEFVPAMRSRESDGRWTPSEVGGEVLVREAPPSKGDASKKEGFNKFKSKLGQKDGRESYEVDYGALFQSNASTVLEKAPKAASDETKRGALANATTFPLPLLAGDIKAMNQPPFRCELSKEEASLLRENFLQDRSSELYLGFEIIDAIYRVQNKLKTYRFPLYYMKVVVEEAGRYIHISPAQQKAEIYLNHLALATLVESFSPPKPNGADPLEAFFGTLLSQKIEVRGRLSELRIQRLLPVADEVFDRVRDLLLGLPGENGKGGILENLKVIGLECDLESVALYKAVHVSSPVTKALHQDMNRIQAVAEENPERFYRSLLGQFLCPELRSKSEKSFAEQVLCPGALPKSTRKLLDRLNQNDLILLEGPPGTGKTFTIMNLLLHSISANKRVLIVSDQKAAIHALVEKVQEYLVGRDMNSPLARSHLALFRDSIKVVDQTPSGPVSLQHWMSMLSESLGLAVSREAEAELESSHLLAEIAAIDSSMAAAQKKIQRIIDERMSGPLNKRLVASKHAHPTTEEDIRDLIAYLDFAGAGRHSKRLQTASDKERARLLKDFISDRSLLASEELLKAYPDFAIQADKIQSSLERWSRSAKVCEELLRKKPRRGPELEKILAALDDVGLGECIVDQWQKVFPRKASAPSRWLRLFLSYFKHPCLLLWRTSLAVLSHQKELVRAVSKLEEAPRILRQLQGIHESMHPKHPDSPSLAFEASQFTLLESPAQESSIQRLLHEMKELQAQRDELVKAQVIRRMKEIAGAARNVSGSKGTSLHTTISNLVEALKECPSIDQGSGVSLLRDLQDSLAEAYPIWICRKQAVSFLFPTQDHLFDLVIIDEAGQCRVDDALPLLFRAKKLMVVGDEKQTVLNKNSVLDDFLFRGFKLEEHLRHTQARGIKGGGSHIFGLVKSIKQAEVMLDEHYRCPPAIIRYSNEYVYGSNLKIMQWQHSSLPPAVVVDYSEKDAKSNVKAQNGKYKDLETELLDRYLDFVAATVKKIEKETGRPINMETDVALCYFLLKNEPYIKDKKAAFLQKLGRGQDVLDGAGAALQGKERDYIFYLWDINRMNIRFFGQGDDPDKRKGELNVLMSRPKVRAYHYLHPDFDKLKHDAATIADYLWKTFQQQGEKKAKVSYLPRKQRPDAKFRPWQRSSGELMRAVLGQILESRSAGEWLNSLSRAECSVVVGDSRRKVDLMLLASSNRRPSLGIIDLSSFEQDKDAAAEVVDYFFQLQRAVPRIEPVFLFMHELADERSLSFQFLVSKLEELLGSQAA